MIFCDAKATDAGYLAPDAIAGSVKVTGRGGTVLQPGIDYLEKASDFPADGPILIITDGMIEDHLKIRRKHAFYFLREINFHLHLKVMYFISGSDKFTP